MIVQRLLLQWHLPLAQGRCAGPDQCLVPPFSCSCFPFMHGQVQPVELPWQWFSRSLGGECSAGIDHTSGIAMAVFLQMICQTAWEFSPNKWWANSGNLFTAHCVSRGGTFSLQAHVKNWAARELSLPWCCFYWKCYVSQVTQFWEIGRSLQHNEPKKVIWMA